MPEFPEKPPQPLHFSPLPLSPPSVPPSLARSAWPSPDDVYSVPRRYGLDSILAVVTAFALLFGALTKLGGGPVVIGLVVLYVVGVGLSQAVLFRGKDPRLASILGGMLMAVLVPLAYLGVVYTIGPSDESDAACCLVGTLTVLSPILGYCAGTVVAGVFLILDAVEGLFRKPRHRRGILKETCVDGDPFGPAQRDAGKDQGS